MKQFFIQSCKRISSHASSNRLITSAAAISSITFATAMVVTPSDTNINTSSSSTSSNASIQRWWESNNPNTTPTSPNSNTNSDNNTNNNNNSNSNSNSNSNTTTFYEAQRTVVNAEQARRRWRQLKVFSGTANKELSSAICDELGVPNSLIEIKRFADGEIGIQILENVRGKDVFIVQPTCPPGVNDNLMELILMISTMRRASAHSITAVLPYYGYARQDRKMASRVPISAADVARLLEAVGVDRVIAVDLHCGQIQGFFGPRTPCDNLDGSVVALPYFKELGLTGDKTVVVSPDAGGVYRAKKFRDGLKAMGIDANLAMIVKQRAKANEISQMDLVGEVKGMDAIIVDDMIDTAGTLCKAGKELKNRGARRIYAFATHGLFNGPAISRISSSEFEKVVVCDTVPLRSQCNKIEVLSIASLLARAIYSVHFKESISELFDIEIGKSLPHTKPIQHDKAPSIDCED